MPDESWRTRSWEQEDTSWHRRSFQRKSSLLRLEDSGNPSEVTCPVVFIAFNCYSQVYLRMLPFERILTCVVIVLYNQCGCRGRGLKTLKTVTPRRSGVPWYNVEWRDHPGGNTWEPVKNLCGEDGVIMVRLFEEERQRQTEEHKRSKVRVFLNIFNSP